MLIDTNNLPVDLAAECLRVEFFGKTEDRFYPSVNLLKERFYFPYVYQYQEFTKTFSDYLSPDSGYHIFCDYKSEKFQAAIWQYDGDCTLILIDDKRAYINTDAKKSHGWISVDI